MKTAIIIHGHFYQPPRENPYTGIVSDQVTAKPFNNWNEAIYQTCYRPNAYSRYLDKFGKVRSITNNYCTISSNFGPTLLNWIEEEHPEFMDKLREADKESLAKTGHSNFIAQCYNHVILPLASPEVRKIQIKWAMDDYRSRFGHKSEGFWCPECAIDKNTIDDLADAGFKFVVLSPFQASAINGKKLNGKPAPSDRPFIIKGYKKKISAFFYDGDLASGISFGHLLTDADNLFSILKRMRIEKKNPKLITCATDGEIYGHHEAFGDMALAALIKKVKKSDEFEFTNYGAYLEKNPATETAELYEGEDGLGSSWSCSHGVGRWYRDCGCHTGGSETWNQKWRSGLRKAFNNLEDHAHEIFSTQVKRILGNSADPLKVLENYSQVLCYGKTVNQYVSSFKNAEGKDLSVIEKGDLAVLLDAMKKVMFMFTSCGWFFNDISGIEPKQNMAYAVYASNALSRFTTIPLKANLLKDLREAKSNIAQEGTGEDIAKRDLPKVPSFVLAAGFFAINRAIATVDDYTDTFGVYRLLSIKKNTISMVHKWTLEKFNLLLSREPKADKAYDIIVTNPTTGYRYNYSGNGISPRSLRIMSGWMDANLTSSLSSEGIRNITGNIGKYVYLINSDRSLAKSNIFLENIMLSIKAIRAQSLSKIREPWDNQILVIKHISELINMTATVEDNNAFAEVINCELSIYSKLLKKGKMTDTEAKHLIEIISLVRSYGINPDISDLQEAIYPVLTNHVGTKINKDLIHQLRLDLNFAEN